MRSASLRRTSTDVGGGERAGQAQAGGRGGRDRRGQRAPRGRRGDAAREHPAYGREHGGDGGVGVPHRHRDDQGGARVHRPHDLDARMGGVQ